MASAESLPQQVEVLYTDHHNWLRAWLCRKLGDAASAADLTHDTFLRILSSGRTQNAALDVLREPRAYVTKIAHDLMVNHLRRRDFERAYVEALAVKPDLFVQSAEAQSLIIESLMEIDALLDQLPRKAGRAFLMSQLDGFTYAEIADCLGVSVSMVKKYMLQAVRLCATVRET